MKVGVVSAFVVRNGRILLSQRARTDKLGFLWETPGGKIEGNESHHQAVRRELKEELGLNVGYIPEESLGSKELTLHGRDLFLLFYLVREFSGEPRSCEGQGFGWFTLAEALALNTTPGTHWALRDHRISRVIGDLCP